MSTAKAIVTGFIMVQETKQKDEKKKSEESLISLQDKTVVVVGAGMAGVATASKLVKQGIKVILLEARDEVGGRARNMCSEQGNVLIPLGPMYLENRGKGFGPECEGRDHSLEALLDTYKIEHQAISKHDFSDTHVVTFNAEEETKLSLDDLLTAFQSGDCENSHALELAGQIQRFLPTTDCGVSAEMLDDRMKAEKELMKSKYYSGFGRNNDEDDHFVSGAGGYQKLIQNMFKEAEAVLGIHPETHEKVKLLQSHFKTAVQSIDCRNEQAKITLKSGETIVADAVVCTVPLGVLLKGDVSIVGLPKETSEALNHLVMAQQMKVIIEFEKPFWNLDAGYVNVVDADFETNSDKTFPHNPLMSFVNLHKFSKGKTSSLIASFYADSVEMLKNKEDEDITQFTLRYLEKAFGKAYQKPIRCTVTRWQRDPLCYGTWATIGPECSVKDVEQLMAPQFEGRLMLAGDHIGPYGLTSTVLAAFESGNRAAAELIHTFKQRHDKKVTH